MPELGLTMEEGTISNWLRTEGDSVEAGDVLCEVETDKLTNEVASECTGVLRAIVAPGPAPERPRRLAAVVSRYPDLYLVLFYFPGIPRVHDGAAGQDPASA